MGPKPKYYKANQGFATTLDGEPLFVQKGELVSAGHPLLKGREELFDVAESFGRFDTADVEQATAAPGEKRGRGRAAKAAEPEKETTAPEPTPAPEPTAPDRPFGLRTSDIEPKA